MRSPRGLIGSILIVASLPAAIAVALITGGGGEPIIHFGVGLGFLLLATAAMDFSPSAAVGWFGAIVAGAFGGIFVLQGVLLPAVWLIFESARHVGETSVRKVIDATGSSAVSAAS
jgi:hypothetical protein